jgi:signal transduction histidine kinase
MLDAALNSMQDAVFISDAAGRFIEINDAFATFHKFSNRQECAKTFGEYPEFLEVYLADGSLAPVPQWAVPRALRGEVASNAEYGLRRKDTGERWIGSYSFGPIRDAQGAIVGSVVVGRDITESKRMGQEIHRLNADLERRVLERTAELQAANGELETFAYAVSHDLRSPLRAMGGFSRALIEDLGPRLDQESRGNLEEIIAASTRMSGLIDGILQLSRVTRGELARQWVDLSALAGQIRRELELGEPERSVVWELEEGLRAWGDGRLLENLLRNLLGNAWKFSAGAHPARICFQAGPRAGWFRVVDNGAGFAMAHAGKLYLPFQRLHRQEEFPGMGIGLATAYRIVQRHGGKLEADSEPGRGASFAFTLPSPQPMEIAP